MSPPCRSVAATICVASLLVAAPVAILMPAWSQFPAPLQALAAQLGIRRSNFEETLTAIDLRTSQRLHEGEWDHLIFYMLQSRTFTPADPIEPARSASAFMAAD